MDTKLKKIDMYFEYNSLKYDNDTKLYTGHIEFLEMPLTYLDCSKCNLVSFPEILNDNIGKINCQINFLQELPAIMPKYLIELYCYCNKLQYLPNTISYCLQKLWCSKNNISELPELPFSIYILIIRDNPISSLSAHNQNVVAKIYNNRKINRVFNCRNTPLYKGRYTSIYW